jgi:hypothetical protein
MPPDQAVLLGDTAADVAAGLASEVPVIGVATDRSCLADFEGAGPARVLVDLTDAGQVITWVTPGWIGRARQLPRGSESALLSCRIPGRSACCEHDMSGECGRRRGPPSAPYAP